jgi:serine/threonine-protein kinase
MSLSAGTRLGQYEILGPIGAGGMGEVYRARDTKLKRDVALKVLPDAFASDAERLARFQRESEVLASLNHPNIAHIYGVEDHALVMELVEGVEPKGPLPFDEAWKIAVQITAALEYAHDKGVIHRDLKPANVKVTPAGVVKLLDFGLAKAISSESSEAQVEARATDSPTLTMGATVAGVILGTASYMAPEQAKGKRVDKRIDIWSWGVVLYELLTGERMFQGDDAAETLAQVLTKQPNLERVPANVRRLLEECLQKDPKLRLRDIGDANRLIAEEDTSATAPSRSPLAWIAAAAALAIALGGLSFVHFREAPPERPRVRFQITPSESLLDFQLSPNGRFLALVTEGDRMADGRLWIRALDSLDSRVLLQTGPISYPFWSPDGEYIAFFSQGQLRRVPRRGGPPMVVCDLPVGGVSGGAWLSDNVIIFSSNSTGEVFRVPAAGGTPSKVSAPPASFAPQVNASPWREIPRLRCRQTIPRLRFPLSVGAVKIIGLRA